MERKIISSLHLRRLVCMTIALLLLGGQFSLPDEVVHLAVWVGQSLGVVLGLSAAAMILVILTAIRGPKKMDSPNRYSTEYLDAIRRR